MANFQTKKTNSELRQYLDSDDGFLNHGHQILKLRQHMHRRPEWVRHPEQIRGLLLRSFPRMDENTKVGLFQRRRAGRWARIIQLYFVMGFTGSYVADELEERKRIVQKTIDRIRTASKGLTTDGFARKKQG